ncbi:MAG: alkaline phosphatase D family protein [Myxococcota bacterium]
MPPGPRLAVVLVALSCGDGDGRLRVAGVPADTGAPDPTGDTAPPVDPCTVDAAAPEAAVYPDEIGTLTLFVRTGGETNDGTDDDELSLCLTETACFPLDNEGVDDFETGALDVFHVDVQGLTRADVDRVRIVQGTGTNRWSPACLAMRFDGDPVYCEDDPGVRIGDGDGEVLEWTDPEGLHQDCGTCAGSPLLEGPMVAPDGPTTARVWVRLDASRDVAVRVAEGDDASAGRIAGWARPAPEGDFTAVVEVGCLEPGRRYAYRVEIDGEPVATGTLATTPEPGASGAWRLGLGSCTRLDDQPIFAAIRDADPDLFVFGGDNHYGNTAKLPALRAAYRGVLAVPERADLVAHVPVLATWDDHDFVGNNSDGRDAGRDEAARAFAEYWGHELHGLRDTPGIFAKATWGDVDLFLLDGRYYRGVDGSMLGDAQLAWLMDELVASTATFKLVIHGSQWTLNGSEDSWASFPSEREVLFDFLAEQDVQGVVLVSGDKHRSEFRWLERDGAYDLPELTASGMSNANHPRCPSGAEVVDCYNGGNNFVLVDVDTTRADPRLEITIREEGGEKVAEWEIQRSELE